MFSDMYCNINNMYVFIIYIFRYEYMLQLVMNTVYMQHWPKSISLVPVRYLNLKFCLKRFKYVLLNINR